MGDNQPTSKLAQAALKAQREQYESSRVIKTPPTKVATVQFVQRGITEDGQPVFVEEKVLIEEKAVHVDTKELQNKKYIEQTIPEIREEWIRILRIFIIMAIVYSAIWFLLDNTIVRTVLTLLSSLIGILVCSGDFTLKACQFYLERPIEKMDCCQLTQIQKLVRVLQVRYTLKTAFFLPLAAASKIVSISLPLSLSGIHQIEQCSEIRESCQQNKELKESL